MSYIKLLWLQVRRSQFLFIFVQCSWAEENTVLYPHLLSLCHHLLHWGVVLGFKAVSSLSSLGPCESPSVDEALVQSVVMMHVTLLGAYVDQPPCYKFSLEWSLLVLLPRRVHDFAEGLEELLVASNALSIRSNINELIKIVDILVLGFLWITT